MKRANDKVGVGLLLVLLCWWRLRLPLPFVVDGDEDYAQGTIYTCFAEHCWVQQQHERFILVGAKMCHPHPRPFKWAIKERKKYILTTTHARL